MTNYDRISAEVLKLLTDEKIEMETELLAKDLLGISSEHLLPIICFSSRS